MANIIGPDVSFYQDDPETPQGIDFKKMRVSAEYVIIRAGQNLWPDPDFKANWREAKLAGFPRGSYWFYDSRADPKRQAELWAQLFEGDFGELPLFADFEESYNGTYKGWKNWYTFLERLKQLINGKEIAIYTAFYYWRDNAPNATTQATNLEYFHQYPLWIANYSASEPLVPKPWSKTEWIFWQYTETGDGKLFGVESNGIDLNYFNGDLAAFRTRFKLSDAPPPPPPIDPNGTPATGVKYRVTASSLKVREGPGLTYNSIGLVYFDEIVEELEVNADKTWIKIRKPDGGLIGWSSSAYLVKLVPAPPPDPGNGNPPPTAPKLLRVTTTSLRVRSGPSLNDDQIGSVLFGEIVEEVGANADRSWLKIHKPNGSLTGWAYSAYLISVNDIPHPTPTEPPSADPLAEFIGLNWYRVTSGAVNMRETPSGTAKIVGAVYKDDTFPASDDTTNSAWVKIVKLNGLTGWCDKRYLQLLGKTRPGSMRQTLYKGATYLRKDIATPRINAMHVMAIDLLTLGIEFLVTPASNAEGILCTRTTSGFLKEFNLHIAINGDGFSYLDASYNPATYCANGGDPVKTNGFAASRGKIYSTVKGPHPIVYFGQKNQVTINTGDSNKAFNAISGDRVVVSAGKPVANLAALVPSPRTAIGLNKNGRWLILMVIDGRQTGYSEGVTLPELADLLISYGVYQGVNMDGGGSSAMVIKDLEGNPVVLNSPIDQNVPRKERAVANHLGIFIR